MPVDAIPYTFPQQDTKRGLVASESEHMVSTVAEDIAEILSKGEYVGHIEVPVRALQNAWRIAGVVMLIDVPESLPEES